MGAKSGDTYRDKLKAASTTLHCNCDESAVVAACKSQADEACDALDEALTPHDRLLVLADRASVHFEVACSDADIDSIIARYAARGELGFATRRDRFDQELLAVILRRVAPAAGDRRFVALVDARGRKEAMAFFSQAHEVAHPVLEPQLAFEFREETNKRDRWEALVDRVGAEMVFSGREWSSAVASAVRHSEGPTIDALFELKSTMAPEASLTAIALAAGNSSDHAIVVIWAGHEVSQRDDTPVLRVLRLTPNIHAVEMATYIHRKRRIPSSSPIAIASRTNRAASGFEDLAHWIDSHGKPLPHRRVWTSAYPTKTGLFATIDFGAGGSW